MATLTGATGTGAADLTDETVTDESLEGAGAAGGDDDGEDLEEAAKAGRSIPAERFKKVNEKFKLTNAELEKLRGEFASLAAFKDFIEDLKADGINDTEGVRAFIANQNKGNFAGARKAAEQKAAADYHAAIDDSVPEKEARAAYELAMQRAEVNYEKAVLAQEKADLKRTSSGSVASKIKAALEKYPEADAETLRDLSQVPGVDIEAKAKQLHDREVARLVGYAKQKTKQGEGKGSAAEGGRAPTQPQSATPPNALKDPKGAKKWLDEFRAKHKT